MIYTLSSQIKSKLVIFVIFLKLGRLKKSEIMIIEIKMKASNSFFSL
jgi:hypothetical protein